MKPFIICFSPLRTKFIIITRSLSEEYEYEYEYEYEETSDQGQNQTIPSDNGLSTEAVVNTKGRSTNPPDELRGDSGLTPGHLRVSALEKITLGSQTLG